MSARLKAVSGNENGKRKRAADRNAGQPVLNVKDRAAVTTASAGLHGERGRGAGVPHMELFSFFSIPLLSRLNYYACIAAAGATSEDTTLPLMIKYTDEETVILSVLNGAICSAFVPVLISLCYGLSGR